MNKLLRVIVSVIFCVNVIAVENGGRPTNESPLVQEFSFKALQCNDVRTTATYSGRKFCDEEKMKKEYGVANREPAGTFTVSKFNTVRKFIGIRCEKKG
jgi:hypothetical protein